MQRAPAVWYFYLFLLVILDILIDCYVSASFLIPYMLIFVMAGLPMFFMEMAFGQFLALGPISVWRVLPLLYGEQALCSQFQSRNFENLNRMFALEIHAR